ncbi:hypothetical protein [Cloacibacillus porcorum]
MTNWEKQSTFKGISSGLKKYYDSMEFTDVLAMRAEPTLRQAKDYMNYITAIDRFDGKEQAISALEYLQTLLQTVLTDIDFVIAREQSDFEF